MAVTATPRHNAIGTASVTVDADHRRLPQLAAEGARLVLTYNGEHLMSGPVRSASGQGPSSAGTLTFAIEDDIRVLWNSLGWPTPTATITTQGLDEDTVTGPAETVAKSFLRRNAVTRMGRPITIAPDLARGATITVAMRMVPTADKLLPAIDTAGVGITVRQVGTGLRLDAYAPGLVPRLLTEASGIITNWTYSVAGPTATRTVIGGAGVGASRQFELLIDTAREALYKDVIEVFTDAGDENISANLLAAGQTALTEAAPKSGLTVELAESANFRYGGAGVHVGDSVSIQVGGTIVKTDVLREATLNWTRDNGMEVTPTVGDRTDDPDVMLAKMLSALAKGIRKLRTR